MPELKIWVIYDKPIDYPNSVVARQFTLDKPTQNIIVGQDIDTVRGALVAETGCDVKIDRHPEDDPKIVEMWL